jgi:hypothetical protein
MLVRFLFLTCTVLVFTQTILPGTAVAQETAPMSSSVVLVLKLVSTTHVKPVTGIVVSADGRVMVPADFVSAESEIIVLDGGTDIISHGRPAEVIEGAVAGGLALLAVEGLNRPAITLSKNATRENAELHLLAFPPADKIAEGAQPLWVPVKVEMAGSTGETAVSPTTPLPNVTGAIIDACGHLVGMNLADGTQSLEAGRTPTTIFSDELGKILDSMQLNLALAGCVTEARSEDAPAARHDKPVADKVPEAEEVKPESTETEPDIVADHEVNSSAVSENATLVKPADTGGIAVVKTDASPSIWHLAPWWLLLSSGVVMILVIWKIILLLRLGRHDATQTGHEKPATVTGLASDEPDTAQLQAGSEYSTDAPRAVPLDATEMPDMNALPNGSNGLVVIEGMLGDDARFKRYCVVNTDQINIVIGRGEADINIEHPAISRAHIRIEGDNGSMTVSDLGSSNGTFIRGIPCLRDEIMFIDSTDEILLGDVRFCVRVLNKEAGQS